MTIGKRIKLIRGQLSRPDFCKKLGVSKASVQKWEIEDKTPKGDILRRIKEEFGVSIDWLLTGEGEPYKKESGSRGMVSGPTVVDDEGLYGATRRHTIEGKDLDITLFPSGEKDGPDGTEALAAKTQDTDLGKAVNLLANILLSGDQVLISAIMSNLRAFNEAVDYRVRAEMKISNLERRVKALEDRHGTGPLNHDHEESPHEKVM